MYQVRLLSRPKRDGLPVKHYGFQLAYPGQHDTPVVEFDSVAGLRRVDYATFASAFTVMIEGHREVSQLDEVQSRLTQLAGEHVPYDLLGNNCEHAARYLFDGTRTSEQVKVVTTAAGILLGLVALTLISD